MVSVIPSRRQRSRTTRLLEQPDDLLFREPTLPHDSSGGFTRVPSKLDRFRGSAHHEPLIRGHAAWALGRIGIPEAVEALRGREGVEEDGWVREELALALGNEPAIDLQHSSLGG